MDSGTGAIHSLAGVFTNEGFVAKNGRKPQREDIGFLPGPISVSWLDGRVTGIERRSDRPANDSLDAEGAVATCGLIDSHTHAVYCGSRAAEHFARWNGDSYEAIAARGGGIHRSVQNTQDATDSELLSETTSSLRRMVDLGITTVEVKTGYTSCLEQELRVLRLLQLLKSLSHLPSIVVTSLALHAVPKDIGEEEHLETMLPLLEVIGNENLAEFVDAFPERGFFSNSTANEFYCAAREKGIPFKVHCDQLTSRGSSSHFATLGATSIDHLENMSPQCAHAVADSATVATVLPTVSLFLGLEFADARLLVDSGARVAIASDFNPGSSPVMGLQLPMLLAASKMKLQPQEIFCGVTYNAAAALNKQEFCGSLLAGKQADIALWRPDKISPGKGIGAIEDIIVSGKVPETVVGNGNVIFQSRAT